MLARVIILFFASSLAVGASTAWGILALDNFSIAYDGAAVADFDSSGTYLGVDSAIGGGIRDLAYDGSGNLYFLRDGVVGKRTPSGTLSSIPIPFPFVPSGANLTVAPSGAFSLAFDGAAVADFDPSGTYLGVDSAIGGGIRDLDYDEAGNLYYLRDGIVGKRDPSGTLSSFAIPFVIVPPGANLAVSPGAVAVPEVSSLLAWGVLVAVSVAVRLRPTAEK